MLNGNDTFVGLENCDHPNRRPFFSSVNRDSLHQIMKNDEKASPLLSGGANRSIKPLRHPYGWINGKVVAQQWRWRDLLELDRMADEAWTLSSIAWRGHLAIETVDVCFVAAAVMEVRGGLIGF
ncbi:hypothetical protein QJS04_geneDACA010839 [Acorus gramineus]|uniref:Uncharacterized protein n=1 Tax=Acorus gramineus TaxID=55184 RepID=A0AAV9B987_ACOGR|nr:hypothetical protein QJS04_geneDACA010839 [Acorus gramineus]